MLDKDFQLPTSDFVVKLKCEISEWIEDFEKVREQILNSDDPRRLNYRSKYFNINEQEEITVLYLKGEIVAFSSLYYRKYYPSDVSRILNRFWKSPKIRYIHKSYWFVARYMFFPQLKKANELGKSAVFISTEGKKNLWLNRFVLEAKKEDARWTILPGMYQVAPGSEMSCWQNVAFLPLKQGYVFRFPHMSKEKWNNFLPTIK